MLQHLQPALDVSDDHVAFISGDFGQVTGLSYLQLGTDDDEDDTV
jgi:hypothetical protein